jgi:hypothetical protein
MSREWYEVHSSWEVSLIYEGGELVAKVPISDAATEDKQINHERVKENRAALIAAAPELLQLLQQVTQFAFYDRWGAKGFDDEAQQLHDKCHDLIGRLTP